VRIPAALGLAAVAGVAIAAILLIGGAPAADQADAIARELRCPDCQALSVADSPTASAAEIRRQIDALLASGESPDAIRAHFVARYGEWILLAPSAPAWWILPLAVVILGAAALLAWLAVAARRAPEGVAAHDPAPDGGTRRRIREDAEALDA
jgi:cytochrome c-type biogenesis protein CcmH